MKFGDKEHLNWTRRHTIDPSVGTLVVDYNGLLYYSPIQWHSPIDGLQAQPEHWIYVDEQSRWRFNWDDIPKLPRDYTVLG